MPYIFAFVVFFLCYGILCTPGMVAINLIWKATAGMTSESSQAVVRSAAIAMCFAPTLVGHGFPLPVFFGIFVNHSWYEVVSLAVVFVAAFIVISIRSFRRSRIEAR